MEGEHAKQKGRLYSLSDMQINACSKLNGCGGGWMYNGYTYGKSAGIGESVEYPYCDACND